MSAALACAIAALGYVLGRLRPVHRTLDWAEREGRGRPTGFRRAAVWVLLSAEDLGFLATHPVRGWHAWRHRNDPPPPRSPAPALNPDWAAKHQDGGTT